jgi:three-Cys-motif partner protein
MKIQSMGYSKYTPIKQDHFRKFITMHIDLMTKITMRKCAWLDRYWYFDLTAGAGVYGGVVGSPIVFAEEALNRPSVNFQLTLIEKDIKSAEILTSLLNTLDLPTNIGVKVICNDYHTAISPYLTPIKAKAGLIYCDPNGDIPPFDLLSTIFASDKYRMVDCLIYVPATTIKRVAKAALCQEERVLPVYMAAINKKHWLVREPIGTHQWSFILGTNWVDFPQMKSIGFYAFDSDEGVRIFRKLTLTAKELNSGGNHAG